MLSQEQSPSQLLTILCRAPADQVKAFAEAVLDGLPDIRVLQNRVGLVMLPMSDPRKAERFYLGEALVAEAQVEAAGQSGYAVCLGRDLVQALAIALLDAASRSEARLAGVPLRERIAAFAAEQEALQAQADQVLLRQVQATHVEMETFEWASPK